jgi:predicted nucleotidyltransferase component of viral defense system
METISLNQLSLKMGISSDALIREQWEMIILSELSESVIGNDLIFKGGTLLRLAYNSPRFSVDLDFDLKKRITEKDFFQVIESLAKKYPAMKIVDKIKKYYTYFALIKINDSNLPTAFSIKIEISNRIKEKRDYYENRLLISPVSNLQVLFPVMKLEKIKKDKLLAVKTRHQARDLFDLWYISQINREPWRCPPNDYSFKELKDDLNKLLPQKLRPMIKQIYESQ